MKILLLLSKINFLSIQSYKNIALKQKLRNSVSLKVTLEMSNAIQNQEETKCDVNKFNNMR